MLQTEELKGRYVMPLKWSVIRNGVLLLLLLLDDSPISKEILSLMTNWFKD
jgi:hypothetical protein